MRHKHSLFPHPKLPQRAIRILTLVCLALLPYFVAQAAVTLVSFTGIVESGWVRLDWETATEIDNSGFFVNRSTTGGSDPNTYTRINVIEVGTSQSFFFVPARGDSLVGAEYAFYDQGATQGTYYYLLESIDSNNLSEYHGPVTVTIGLVVSPTLTPTPTGTSIPTGTPTPTGTFIPTNSPTPSPSPSGTLSDTPTPTETLTPTPTASPTHTSQPGNTPTPAPTNTPISATATPVSTLTPAPTPAETETPGPSATPTPEPDAPGTPISDDPNRPPIDLTLTAVMAQVTSLSSATPTESPTPTPPSAAPTKTLAATQTATDSDGLNRSPETAMEGANPVALGRAALFIIALCGSGLILTGAVFLYMRRDSAGQQES